MAVVINALNNRILNCLEILLFVFIRDPFIVHKKNSETFWLFYFGIPIITSHTFHYVYVNQKIYRSRESPRPCQNR